VGTSEVVQASIAEWQKRLLQLDRRNNLLYFKQGSRSAVRILADDIDEFLVSLTESRVGLEFDYAERRARRRADPFDPEPAIDPADEPDEPYIVPGDIRTDHKPLELQPRLKSLRRKDREWREEQGVNVLFLAVGFVSWVDEDSVEGKAPILLVPCDLEVASPRDPFVLVREPDDIEVNATLVYKLGTLGVQLREFDGDRAPSDYLNEVERLIRSKPGWSVAPEIVLSTFQYSKMAMWKDLDQLAKEGVEQDLVRALAGDPDVAPPATPPDDAVFNQAIDRLAGGRLDDALDAREQLLVLPADYSQVLAVAAARSGTHLVIHGPPGTGKSQTIANIIGSFIADGKSVLFVSEKTAALDVVKRRLEECGLGAFCLDLHSERGKKSNVYEQLRAALEDPKAVSRAEFDFDSLLAMRVQLNAYVRALHERRMPLGQTVYRMHGRLAQLRAAPDVAFDVDCAGDLDDAKIREVTRLAGRLAQRRIEFQEHSTSLWLPLRDSSNPVRLADELRLASRSAQAQLQRTEVSARRLQSYLGGDRLTTLGDVTERASVLPILAVAPGVPRRWLNSAVVHHLVDVAQQQQAIQREWMTVKEQFEEHFGSNRPPLRFADIAETFDAALGGEDQLVALLGHDWNVRCVSHSTEVFAAAEQLPAQAESLANQTSAVSTLMGAKAPARRSDLRRLLGQAATIGDLSPVPACWANPPLAAELNSEWIQKTGREDASFDLTNARSSVQLIEARVSGAAELASQLKDCESALLEEYEDQIVGVVDHDMLVRYRTDYRSFLKRLGGQYRSDQRLLKGNRKSPAKITLDEATATVELAFKVQTLRNEWQAQASLLPRWLGARFKGRDSDWPGIANELSKVSNLFATLSRNDALASCLTTVDTTNALSAARQSCESAFAAMERLELTVMGKDRTPSGSDPLGSVRDLTVDALPALRNLSSVLDALRENLAHDVGTAQEVSAILAIAVQHEEMADAESKQAPELRDEFGERYRGFDTDWEEVLSALKWTVDCLRAAPSTLPPELVEHAEHPQDPDEYRRWNAEVDGAVAEFDHALAAVNARFDVERTEWDSWRGAAWSWLSGWLQRVETEADTAADFLNYRTLVGELERMAGEGVVSRIRHATDDASLVPPIVERRYVTAWLESVYEHEPCLRQFSPRDQRDAIAAFRQLDEKMPTAAQREIRRRAFSRYPERFVTQAGGGQLGALRDQLSRRRGQLPVRKLITRIPALLQALKPCFMMSPLAVSQFLPKGAAASETLRFDAVVFDEASQIFPEDAVPAVERASQVIVVGDEKQLPPTSFFRRDLDGEEDLRDDDDTDDADALKGRDSILEAMDGMLGRGVGERYLEVHYRSRHENLIRFSNHHFYRDRLLVFPSPESDHADIGLRGIYLQDGRYDSGASRTNRREAEEVVRLVFEHMRTRPSDESIGVVTLSRPQADLVESLINEQRMLERDTDERFREDIKEPFFVKNLENVQGDERDHIILTIGYGPTVGSGAVPNRFGPLNAEGGERRLNVAVSRARRSMTTVYSLRPTDISSEQAGARLLRRYLEFVENPVSAFEAAQTIDPAAEPESPFEEAVIEALRTRGHRIQPQVGVAGFRIDLAILSDDGTRCDLGIECDGWAYHGSPAARDRDWLRQSILEGLGWRIHRVWSTAWIRNPDEQIKAIEAALELARIPSVAGGSATRIVPTAPTVAPRALSAPPTPQPTSNWIFAPYEAASLRGLRHGPELQYAPRSELEPMLMRVAEVEGPVHIDVAIERIREHYGMARARQASRDQVRRVLEDMGKRKQLTVWRERASTRQGPASESECFFDVLEPVVTPRRPYAASSARRSITQISCAEIEQGLELVARAMFGASPDELVRETARQFWYDRTGPDIAARIQGCIETMTGDGRLIESFGMLTAPERSED
jgi:very-short-patch-repair endonuclease/DNA polymerase III delta prime subunit